MHLVYSHMFGNTSMDNVMQQLSDIISVREGPQTHGTHFPHHEDIQEGGP